MSLLFVCLFGYTYPTTLIQLTIILRGVFSPSVHESFGEDELEQKRAYEMAERLGASGANCDLIYDRCHRSVLSDFSNLVGDDRS